MSVLFDTRQINRLINNSNFSAQSLSDINCTYQDFYILEAMKQFILECRAVIPNSRVDVRDDIETDSIRISFKYYVPIGHYDNGTFLEVLLRYQNLNLNIRSIDIYNTNDFKLYFRIQIETLKRNILAQFEKAMRMFYKYIERNCPSEIRRQTMHSYSSTTATRSTSDDLTYQDLTSAYNSLSQNFLYDGNRLFQNWFTNTAATTMPLYEQDTYHVTIPNNLYRIRFVQSETIFPDTYYTWSTDTTSAGNLYHTTTGTFYSYENMWYGPNPAETQKQDEYLKRLQSIKIKAERRAENFLKELVHEVDFRNYKKEGFIQVIGESGNIYRLYKNNQTEILKPKRFEGLITQELDGDLLHKVGSLEPIGRILNNRIIKPGEEVLIPAKRLCIHSRRRAIPETDEVIARLLMIRYDERKFLKVAHVLN